MTGNKKGGYMDPTTTASDLEQIEILKNVCDIADIDISDFWKMCKSSVNYLSPYSYDIDNAREPCPEFLNREYVLDVFRSQFVVWLAGELGEKHSKHGVTDYQDRLGWFFTWLRHDKSRLYTAYFEYEPPDKTCWRVYYQDQPRFTLEEALESLGETSSLEEAVDIIVQTEHDILGVSMDDVRQTVNSSQHIFAEDKEMEDSQYIILFNGGIRTHKRIPTSDELTEIWGRKRI